MKKNLTFANGKLVLLVLLTVFTVSGCNPEAVDPNPDPPPPVSGKPKITVNSVTPTNLVYNGSANPQTTVTISFSVTGNTTVPTVNGQTVSNGLFTSGPVFSGQKFIIAASNAQGTTSYEVNITVSVDPVMTLLTNKRFLITKLVQDGVPLPSSIEYDDTVSFALDSKVSVHRGAAGFWGTWPFYLSNNKTVINGWYSGGAEILKLTADSLVYRTYTSNVPAVEHVRHLARLPE